MNPCLRKTICRCIEGNRDSYRRDIRFKHYPKYYNHLQTQQTGATHAEPLTITTDTTRRHEITNVHHSKQKVLLIVTTSDIGDTSCTPLSPTNTAYGGSGDSNMKSSNSNLGSHHDTNTSSGKEIEGVSDKKYVYQSQEGMVEPNVQQDSYSEDNLQLKTNNSLGSDFKQDLKWDSPSISTASGGVVNNSENVERKLISEDNQYHSITDNTKPTMDIEMLEIRQNQLFTKRSTSGYNKEQTADMIDQTAEQYVDIMSPDDHQDFERLTQEEDNKVEYILAEAEMDKSTTLLLGKTSSEDDRDGVGLFKPVASRRPSGLPVVRKTLTPNENLILHHITGKYPIDTENE